MDESVQQHLLTSVKEVLLASADYIEKHGWYQGGLQNPSGRVCLIGAVSIITQHYWTGLSEVFPIVYYLLKKELGGTPEAWNDVVGRTKEQVVAKLRDIALYA